MKKVIVSKGEVSSYNNLTTDTLIVDGMLKITGTLTAKNIRGNGVIETDTLSADDVKLRVCFARSLVIRSGRFEKLYVGACEVCGALTVTDFVQALDLRAKRLTISRQNIGNCDAAEILPCRERFAPNTFRRARNAAGAWLKRLFRRDPKALAPAVAAVPTVKPEPVPLMPDAQTVRDILDALGEKGYEISRAPDLQTVWKDAA